jgi:cell wall-associated NlpC family hydrolase
LGAAVALGARPARAAPPEGSLLDYVRGRRDLGRRARRRWARAVKVRFGGAALEPASPERPEVGVARQVLARALFLGLEPEAGAQGAWAAWRSALQDVPPPIAIHYQELAFEGRRPRGRPIDLALAFPEYYVEEIAPDLVVWWTEALEAGTLPDAALADTREALARTRVKMRPLLVDKLRLLARLDRARQGARGARAAELDRDLEALEAELARAFRRVSRRPEVLDREKRPYDRLLLALDDFGLRPTEEDRYLDPDGPPPPRREVPTPEAPPAAPEPSPDSPPLVEPTTPPPLEHLPPQPRPGDPRPWRDSVPGRPASELAAAYRTRLRRRVKPWLGTPYRWGNDTPGVGTDCSGFTRALLEDAFGLELPRTSRDQFRCGRSVPRSALRPGDLVFFDTDDDGRVNHVGIFLGEGQLAHASATRGVVREPLKTPYLRRSFQGARRVLAFER